MTLNFSGLGISVSAKDLGATKMAAGLSTAFGGVSQVFDSLGVAAIGAAGGVGALVASAAGTKLMQIAHNVAEFSRAGQNLTTSFEAAAQAHGAAATKIVSNTGKTGKELKKLSGEVAGLTMGLGMSQEAAGKGVVAWHDYQKELKNVGITSSQNAAAMQELWGVDMVKFAQQQRSFQKLTGATDEQMKSLNDEMAATGRTTQDMSGVLSKQNDIYDLGNRRLALMNRGISQIGGPDAVKGMLRGSRYLAAMGAEAGKTLEMSTEIETSIVEAQEKYGDMFAGMANDLHDLPSELSVVAGDITEAWKLASTDTGSFIKKMGETFAKVDPAKRAELLNFWAGRLGPTFKKSMPDMVNVFGKIDKSSLDAVKNADKLGDSLGHMAKEGWQSSKTLQDAWDMMMGAAQSRFRSIGRSAATELLGDTRKAFDGFNSQMEDIVKKGGPLASIVTKMSEMSSIGAKALLPKNLQPLVTVFGDMYTSLEPSLGALGKLRGMFSEMSGTTLILSAALGGFTALLLSNKTATNTWGDALKKTFNQIGDKVKEIWGQIPIWFEKAKEVVLTWLDSVITLAAEFDWGSFFADMFSGIAAGLDSIANIINDSTAAITEAFTGGMSDSLEKPTHFQKTMKSIGKVVTRIWEEAKYQFNKINWAPIMDKLGAALGMAWDRFVYIVSPYVDKALDAFWGYLKQKFSEIDWGEVLSNVGSALASALGTVIQSAIEAQVYIVKEGAKRLFDHFVALAIETVGTLLDKFDEIWAGIKANAMTAWNELFGNSIIPDMVEKGFGEITGTVERFVKFVEDSVVSRLVGAFSNAVNAARGLFGGDKAPSEAVGDDMVASLQAVHSAVDKMKIEFKSFMKTETEEFHKFADGIVHEFRSMWITVLSETAESARSMASTISGSLGQLETMRTALQEIRSARSEIAASEKQEAQKSGAPREMVDAIDRPDWYWKDFRSTFLEQTNAIKDAVNKSGIKAGTATNAAETQATTLRERDRQTVRGPGTPTAAAPPQGAVQAIPPKR